MRLLLLYFICLTASVFSTDKLRVYDDSIPDKPIFSTSEHTQITKQLNAIGVRFEQWETNHPLIADATPEDVFDAYRKDIDRLVQENGYRTVDIVRMSPDAPKKKELRNKFFNEHTHTEDEVRLFVEGSGLFYLHYQKKVFLVLCKKGDLISIPAYYAHWFDMGEAPFFTAIRFFTDPSGWVAQFTESPIAEQFPRYE